MTQSEQLRNLLKNARDELFIIRGRASLLEQIDAALAEPVENSDARVKELETLLAFQKDMNASDLRLLRSFEAALDSTQVVIDRMNKELSEARAEAAAYKRDFEAELAGNAALRKKHGALDNETMFDFIDRLVRERDEADVGVHVACIKLQEIVDLVGEGGDGSAFGSVESMLAANKHLLETLTQQRDMARAEVEMLRGVGCMEDGDGPCGVCRKCYFRRGAEGVNNGIE